MKRLNDIETDQVSLEVYECDCGFHVGLDATYLDQIDNLSINCPNCEKVISTVNNNELERHKQ